MGNSLRCCIACVFPCGALYLIRVVHLNGHVEEITRSITATEFLKSHPNHVLTPQHVLVSGRSTSNPQSSSSHPILSSREAASNFPIRCSSLPHDQYDYQKRRRRGKKKNWNNQSCSASSFTRSRPSNKIGSINHSSHESDTIAVSGSYDYECQRISEIELQRRCLRRDQRRHSRTASWLPHLESIAED